MQCSKPIRLKEIVVPCGKCIGCRMSRSREWSTRIMHETAYHEDGNVFITITYNDESLPSDESLNKEDFIRFIRRLKTRFNDRKLKYFACGEYGEETKRPHYHAIIFGLGFSDLAPYRVNSKIWASKLLQDIWPYGHNTIGSVTYKSARYVADYIGKMDDRPELVAFRELPFKLQSQGIGKRWCLDNRKQIEENMNITLFGQSVGIPKAYQKWLDLPRDFFIEKAIDRENDIHEKMMDRAKRHYNSGYFKEKEMALEQYSKNLKARKELKTKGRF